MNRLPTAKKIQVISALVEGCSVRSTVRMTGVAKGTILRLLVEVGTACAEYQDRTMRNLTCKRIQADEIWSFVGCKQRLVTTEKLEEGFCGDVWTWAAIDPDTKLVPCWLVGLRDAPTARNFIDDLAGRLAHRVQLTTDGHKPYLVAVKNAFGNDIDYAMLIKLYGLPADGERHYSPPQCIGAELKVIAGNPNPEHISTSYVERPRIFR